MKAASARIADECAVATSLFIDARDDVTRHASFESELSAAYTAIKAPRLAPPDLAKASAVLLPSRKAAGKKVTTPSSPPKSCCDVALVMVIDFDFVISSIV